MNTNHCYICGHSDVVGDILVPSKTVWQAPAMRHRRGCAPGTGNWGYIYPDTLASLIFRGLVTVPA